jgi:hypothetical protein
MSYKSDIAGNAIGIIVFVGLIGFGIPWVSELGQESASNDILEQCQNHQSVTINGIEIHCGVIHKNVNQEAAKYRGVKQCVKLIGAWNDEQR